MKQDRLDLAVLARFIPSWAPDKRDPSVVIVLTFMYKHVIECVPREGTQGRRNGDHRLYITAERVAAGY